MVIFMRAFFVLYSVFVSLRFVVAIYFGILSVTTAPEDTSELMAEVGPVMEYFTDNTAIDLTLLVVGLVGLVVAFGWGNWRLAAHRHLSKAKLRRLESEARRVAEDIANTISQERHRRDTSSAREFEARASGAEFMRANFEQDQRYLSKHMMESASISNRLREIGYWRPESAHIGIGVAGATTFAAEETCKELYTAADRIKSDLEDGIISIVTQPRLSLNSEEKKPR